MAEHSVGQAALSWRKQWSHRIPRFQLRRRPRRIKFPIGRPTPALEPGFTREADLDFLDHIHREEFDQPDLPWES